MVASKEKYRLYRTGYVQLRGGSAAEYVECGHGPPLVLVPGLAGGVDLLEPLIDSLSKHHRVIAYQLRGEDIGLFERGYTLETLVDDLGQVIDGLRLERPGLVGVSFGAAVALDFAIARPQHLAFLAVQGASQRYQPGLFGDVARRVLDTLPLPANSPFLNQFFSLLVGQRRREGDLFDFIVDRSWQTDQSVMAYRLSLLDDYDVEEHCWAVDTPTLVMAGERDMLVSAAESQDLCRLLPRAEFQLLEDAGHLAFVTHATKFAGCMRDFEMSYQLV